MSPQTYDAVLLRNCACRGLQKVFQRCDTVVKLSCTACGNAMKAYNFDLPSTLPPSITMWAPFKWLDALEHRYTTVPAISSGFPSLLFGLASASACVPPVNAIRPFAILVGKKPGAMLLQRIPRGPSSTARFRVRWSAAAFDAL